MTKLAALVAGIIFGAGLVISGMTNPDKVQAFLTLNSHWDISLIFVMGSALVVASIGYAISNRRVAPLFADDFHAPVNRVIDQPLLAGSALFGVGWALSGFCPGPAIVGAFTLDARALLFLLAYLVGVLIFEQTSALKSSTQAAVDG